MKSQENMQTVQIKKKKQRSYNRKEDQSNGYHMSPFVEENGCYDFYGKLKHN